MKAFTYKLFCIGLFLSVVFGCDTTLDPSEWDENWHLEQVCYTVYVENSHQPIQGAIITLLNYDDPVCPKCPMDLQSIVTDANGEACITLSEGWTCESTVVSAEGFVSHTFTGKPPTLMYLTPDGN